MYTTLVHRSPVARICGQNNHGAQSVVLSGGYEDDEDHGERFIYTGCGGKDLGGNKRTNKEHSSDQKFVNRNESLRISCRMGYPVRVLSDVHGDRPRPLPAIKELKNATDITERKESPSWDYDEDKECWIWKKPPPPSKIRVKKQACEEKLTRKRKTSNNAENVVDDGAVRNKKGKMAAAAAV
ncbi:hypothetical protein ACLB2K_031539 [Fragaria x ananassa]